MIPQILILLLIAVSARIAIGLYQRKNMWKWIVAYWIFLTIKNLSDFFL